MGRGKGTRRHLRIENLEGRRVLAASLAPSATPDYTSAADVAAVAHNASMPNDVNSDQRVSVHDALIVVNHLQRTAAEGEATAPILFDSSFFVDTDGDGEVTILDALRVINQLYENDLDVPEVDDPSSPTGGGQDPDPDDSADDSGDQDHTGDPVDGDSGQDHGGMDGGGTDVGGMHGGGTDDGGSDHGGMDGGSDGHGSGMHTPDNPLDLNQTAQHHMLHHDIPDLTANPTHVVAESGNWSELDVLADLNQDSVVVIEEGHTVVFDSTAVRIKSVGVYGTLKFRADIDTSITLQEMFVHGSGYLEIGTKANPIAANVTAEIVIGDRPIDLQADPTQAGNGIIVFGKIVTHGETLEETFVRLSKSPRAGDTTLSLSHVPGGWSVGDLVRLPATTINEQNPAAESFRITAINGKVITLDAPLGFDRPSAVGADLTTVVRGFDDSELHGYVANVSRNILFTSENPDGNRGHFIAVGSAFVDLRYTSLEHLGRTSMADLDSTTRDENGDVDHVGSNQIGRYALHLHHVWGPADGVGFDPDVDPADGPRRQFRLVGNQVSETRKWGIVVHESHYGLILDNVMSLGEGAGIVTEGGGESFNRFESNFSFAISTNDELNFKRRLDTEGRFGSAFWGRGVHNDYIDNVAAASREGFSFRLAHQAREDIVTNIRPKVPLFPGASTIYEGQYEIELVRRLSWLQFSGNEVFATSTHAWGLWQGRVLPGGVHLDHMTIWNSGNHGMFLDYSVMELDHFIFVGRDDSPSIAIYAHFGDGAGQQERLHIKNFNVQRALEFFHDDTRPTTDARFEDGFIANYMHNVVHAYQQGMSNKLVEFENVRFGAIAGHELKTIRTAITKQDYLRIETRNDFNMIHAVVVLVRDHQGIEGNDFRIFFDQQMPDYQWTEFIEGTDSNLRWHSSDFELDNGEIEQSLTRTNISMGAFDGPLTTQQMWDRYRVAPLSEIAWNANYSEHADIPSPTAPLSGPPPVGEMSIPLPHMAFADGQNRDLTDTMTMIFDNADLDVAKAHGAALMRFRIDDGDWVVVNLTDTDGRVTFDLDGLATTKNNRHHVYAQYGALDETWWGVIGYQIFTTSTTETDLVANAPEPLEAAAGN